MAIRKSPAIAVRIYEYSETSIVASFLTPEWGLARVMCKGARRKAKAYESAIDLLVLGEITFYERASGLHVLKEFAPQDTFPGLRSGLERYRAAMACLEFVRAVAVEGEPAPELFEIFRESMAACGQGPWPRGSTYSFIMGGLVAAGFAPLLDLCAACGRGEFPQGEKARRAFSFTDGGVLCMRCGRGKKVEMWLARDALDTLRALRGMRPAEAAREEFEGKVSREVRDFLRRWCEFTFEQKFRMLG